MAHFDGFRFAAVTLKRMMIFIITFYLIRQEIAGFTLLRIQNRAGNVTMRAHPYNICLAMETGTPDPTFVGTTFVCQTSWMVERPLKTLEE